MSRGDVDHQKLIDEGLKKHPNYYQLYFSAVEYLAPNWHGSDQEIEIFAREAVERTRPTEGKGMYARIFWFASQRHYGERLFVESDLVWEKMREGIYDVVKAYPDSWNLQNFAYFSCLARDKVTTKMLFDKIKEPMIRRAWKRKQNFDSCRHFANS